jgi:hypothetical protein
MKQNFFNILESFEFEYLGSKYILLINFLEDCMGEGCRYRCYNLFDITHPMKILQVSFSSVFEGLDCLGDFNNDGVLDFVRAAPKSNDDKKGEGGFIDHYLLTSFSIQKGQAKQLYSSSGHPYYLYVKGDEEVKSFTVLQADWFFSLKNEEGKAVEPTPYFAEYISFDPMYRHLYNPEGIKIEKNRWSVHVMDLGDLESAQDQCRRIQEQNIDDVFIMIDQYSGDITFQILVGNFVNKEVAQEYKGRIAKIGLKVDVTDLRAAY